MKDFNEIYSDICQSSGKEIEKMRKQNQKKTFWILIISVLSAILFIYLFNNLTFIIPIIVIDISFFLFDKSGKKYKRLFKEEIVGQFVKCYSNNLEYIPEIGLDSRIYSFAEFERFNKYYTEDLIIGNMPNGLRIAIAEVITQRETLDLEGNKSTYTIFHGLFTEVELTKNINFNLKIRKNTLLDGKIFGNKTKINMDSNEFEKIFDVHTTDKIKCMQILTADIMQLLIDFKMKNKITPEFTLKQNRLYIRFETGSVFEPKLTKSAIDYDMLNKYYNIINFTLELAKKFSENVMDTEL